MRDRSTPHRDARLTGRPRRHGAAALGLLLLVARAAAATPGPFTDVTAAAGLGYAQGWLETGFSERRHIASGVACGDYDGDGRPDLYVTRGDVGPNLLFRNRGDGTFAEVGAQAGVAVTGEYAGALFADYDGDGRPDLLVLGIEGTPPRLFRNRGDGTFDDVTAAAGLAGLTATSMSAAFGDPDRDGDLDLVVTHWGDTRGAGASPLLYWRNDGGHFVDASLEVGLPWRQSPTLPLPLDLSGTPNFADIDGDGWPDLLIAGDFATSRVYRNDRTGHFVDVTTPVISDENGMGAAVGDYDGDGDLDWFVSSIWDPNGVAEGNWGVTGNRLYRNRGDGTFDDVTDAAGVRQGYWGWGSTFADLDDDGDIDLFHVNGWYTVAQAAEFLADPARLFVSNGDGTFTEEAAAAGVADTGLGRGVVAFDYDGDGDLDLFVANVDGPSRLFRNDGAGGHWLEVVLRGRTPNTQGIGARVRVTADGRTQMREIRAGSNFESQDPALAHVGLGASTTADVEVTWPDGTRTVRARVRANRRLVVAEASAEEEAAQRRRCILALNAGGERIAGAVAARLVGCVEAGLAGDGATACVAGDPTARIATTAAAAARRAAKQCPTPPAFGPSTPAGVAAAMTAALRPQDVFGPDLDAALAAGRSDAAVARCQVAAAKSVAKLTTAKLKSFDACKRAGLAAGTITSAAGLAACHAATSGPTVARVTARTQRSLAAACAGVDLATALPGRCGAAALDGLAACVEGQAACGACMALDAADGLATACHRYTDGVATLYCGDRPATTWSIARRWDEVLLDAIRRDTPRPTVHARNLYHLSGTMWDAWRAYGGDGSPWRVDESHASDDPARDRAVAISFAAYRLLAERFAHSPGATATEAELRATMYALGYDVDFTDTAGDAPAAVGNRIAAAVIAWGLTDGSNEAADYADPTYAPVNPPLIVRQPGTTLVDPNRWQPLALDQIVTQNGIVLPDKVQTFIGSGWDAVTPFALVRTDPSDVYVDPGPPPQAGTATDADYKAGAGRLIELQSELTPDDGVLIDVSPGALGNNPLGTNDGTGHALNPVTGQPYAPEIVPRGDFGRIMAEFWADGPNSETPPGHWNVLANQASDDPLATHRLAGAGPALDRLEWDVKLYLAVNGAVHDAAIAGWGLKRKYDSVRAISMIRWLGGHGQSSDPGLPSYDPEGLVLVPGLVELITAATTAPGQRHAALAGHEGEIAVRAWRGQPADPATQIGGVGWRRAVEWVPYQKSTFVTPAFASFISGHSTFSRAAAEVLAAFTGSAFVPGGLGRFHAAAHQYLGFEDGPSVDVDLQWATWYDAADLAGQSRLWGGIHIPADDFTGRIVGSQAGIGAYARALQYFAGTVGP